MTTEPTTHRLSVRLKHYHDSPWREYLILGAPNGTWTAVGEGDYYVNPCPWTEIVKWIVSSHEWEGLAVLTVQRAVTIEEFSKEIRTVSDSE